MNTNIVEFLSIFIRVTSELLIWLIVIRVIFSWIRPRPNRFVLFIKDITEPILRAARRVTPGLGMLDLSPIVAFIGIQIITRLILHVLANINL